MSSDWLRPAPPSGIESSLTSRRLLRLSDWVDIAALALLPLILIVLDRSWTFLRPGGEVDSYIYTGFFLNLREYIGTFGAAYYASRLPWLLLGAVVYRIPSIDAANLTLRLLLFYGGTVAVYVIIRALWRDRLAAVLTAVLLGVNPYFLGSVRWNYIDGPALVAMLATMALLALAVHSPRWRLLLLAAGVTALTAISIQIFLLFLMPLVFIAYGVLCLRTRGWRSFLESAAWAAGGGIVTFTLYAVINAGLGGSLDYLAPQLRFAGIDTSVLYALPYSAWLGRAVWLLYPAVGAVLALALLVWAGLAYSRRRDLRRLSEGYFVGACVAFQMLAALAIFAFLQVSPVKRVLDLQVAFYTTYLLAFAFVAIGSVLAIALSRRSGARLVIASALVIVWLLAPMGSSHIHLGVPPFWLSGALTAIAAALLLAALARHSPVPAIAALALMALINLAMFRLPLVTASRIASVVTDHRAVLYPQVDETHDRAQLVFDANDATRRFDSDQKLLFWYDKNEPLGAVYRGVASLHLWDPSLISESFPLRKDSVIDRPPVPIRGTTIAILSSRGDALAQADATLAQSGLELQVIHEQTLQRGSDGFKVYIGRVVRDPSAAAPCSTPEMTADLISPLRQGDVVHVTADVVCGGVPVYAWLLGTIKGSGIDWKPVMPYGPKNSFDWDTGKYPPGAYAIGLRVENQGEPNDDYDASAALPFTTRSALPIAPCAQPTLTSNAESSVQRGTIVRFNGGAGCSGTPVFAWRIGRVSGSTIVWKQATGFDHGNMFIWDTADYPTADYLVGFQVEHQAGPSEAEDASASLPFNVTAAPPASPCTNPKLITDSPTTLRQGATVHFSGSAECGGTPAFGWEVGTVNGAAISWQQATPYLPNKGFDWNTSDYPPGSYRVGFWVDNKADPSDQYSVAISLPFTIAP